MCKIDVPKWGFQNTMTILKNWTKNWKKNIIIELNWLKNIKNVIFVPKPSMLQLPTCFGCHKVSWSHTDYGKYYFPAKY